MNSIVLWIVMCLLRCYLKTGAKASRISIRLMLGAKCRPCLNFWGCVSKNNQKKNSKRKKKLKCTHIHWKIIYELLVCIYFLLAISSSKVHLALKRRIYSSSFLLRFTPLIWSKWKSILFSCFDYIFLLYWYTFITLYMLHHITWF